MGYSRMIKNTGKPYMNGADVTAVQTALKADGFDPKGVDGSFGPDTEAAVKAFQLANGLEVDGVVGPKTWAKLFPSVMVADPPKDDLSPAERLCAFVAAQVENGSIYVLGAQGQTGKQITEPWIKMREHYDASNYNRSISLWNKRLEAGYNALFAYDCSGLIVKWLMDNGYLKSDKTANGLYFDACDPISKSELRAGDLVFRKYVTKNQMYHVGVYMGDGTVVHCKGRDDGVVREKFSSTYWRRYGRLKYFDSPADGSYTRMLKYTGKPYMSGADVMAVQTALAAKGYTPGDIDGTYGPVTEAAVKAFQMANGLDADGIVGPKTWSKLVG